MAPGPPDRGSPVLHRAAQRTAAQHQIHTPSPSPPHFSPGKEGDPPCRGAGLPLPHSPRCRWLPAGESALSWGCQSPVSPFGPAPARTLTLPTADLVQTRTSSSHRSRTPLSPQPPASSYQMTWGPAPVELVRSRVMVDPAVGRQEKWDPGSAWVQTQTCARCSLPCPMPSCSSCPGISLCAHFPVCTFPRLHISLPAQPCSGAGLDLRVLVSSPK